jgi:hypothetical protein
MKLLFAVPVLLLIVCIVWLHWRALKDGAFHDAVLFLTGVSIVFYVVTRWDRAKYPILGVVGAIVLISVAILVSGFHDSQ